MPAHGLRKNEWNKFTNFGAERMRSDFVIRNVDHLTINFEIWSKVREPVFGVTPLKLVYHFYPPSATPCFSDPTIPFDQWKFFFLLKLISCQLMF